VGLPCFATARVGTRGRGSTRSVGWNRSHAERGNEGYAERGNEGDCASPRLRFGLVWTLCLSISGGGEKSGLGPGLTFVQVLADQLQLSLAQSPQPACHPVDLALDISQVFTPMNGPMRRTA
jgi:hypothetical protein